MQIDSKSPMNFLQTRNSHDSSCYHKTQSHPKLLRIRMVSKSMMLALLLLFIVPLIVLLADCQASLKVTRFDVPSPVVAGQPTRLLCQYQISGFPLRAMKLFKDNKEFYRYVPRNEAKNQEEKKLTFKVPGVDVSQRRSNSSYISLNSVSRHTAGMFKCQIWAEDTFESVSEEREMQIIEAPIMLGNQNQRQKQASQQTLAQISSNSKGIQQRNPNNMNQHERNSSQPTFRDLKGTSFITLQILITSFLMHHLVCGIIFQGNS